MRPRRSTPRSSSRSRRRSPASSAFDSWDEYDAFVRSFPYWEGFDWDDEIQAYYRGDAEELPDGAVRPRCRRSTSGR